jgi:hypothetical protein
VYRTRRSRRSFALKQKNWHASQLVSLAKGSWDLLFYGQNLANKLASTFTTSGQDIEAQVPLRPRVLGLKVGFKV